ncbi:MAG TPA: metal-dependent hydrolase [Methanotrichaceae archaeon]|nr:metal-dependent hydrolase [Methanotrichaceae archaeon]
MDLFTHALAAYFLGILLKRDKKEMAALVLGGIAPDFDVLLVWINSIHPSYLLIAHRGITHTILFGFITILMLTYLASRLGPSIPRLNGYYPQFSGRCIALGYAGVVMHLLLDYTTTKGVPFLFPFSYARSSAEVFFYTEMVLTLASLALWIVLLRHPHSSKVNARTLAAFLIILAIIGAIRVEGKEEASDLFQGTDHSTFPTSNLFKWEVLQESEDKIAVHEYNMLSGSLDNNQTLERLNIASGQAGDLNAALKKADRLPQVEMFKWRAYAVALNASFDEGGDAWDLEYYDPVIRTETRGIRFPFAGAFRGYGSLKVRIDAE